MRAFVSYSTAVDQIVALRLQTLAAVYGITSYVPPAETRNTALSVLREDVQTHLNESDVVLVVMMHPPAATTVSEMSYALAKGKLLIPIVSRAVPSHYYSGFQHFEVDPIDPSRTEAQIVQFLATKNQVQNGTALLAFVTLALGLVLFASDSK